MSVIPCEKNKQLEQLIKNYAETLRSEAHTLGAHGLSETDFYQGGLFRGAVERLRGQFSATMRGKRDFVRDVLNHMQDHGHIKEWESAGDKNRHDYTVRLKSGRVSVIELKGCLDGNNTIIFERPAHAQEFIIWSVCSNHGADPKKNVWSGLHTRLSADLVERQQRVDGVIVWDWLCGTVARPCPKLAANPNRTTTVAQYVLPPACIYVLPATIVSTRNNPSATSQSLDDVQILKAFHECFGGFDEEVNYVDFDVQHRGAETLRRTRIRRGNTLVKESALTPIRRK